MARWRRERWTCIPYRVRFELVATRHDVSLSVETMIPALAEGFRLSATGQGRGKLLQIDVEELLSDIPTESAEALVF